MREYRAFLEQKKNHGAFESIQGSLEKISGSFEKMCGSSEKNGALLEQKTNYSTFEEGMVTERPRKKERIYLNCTPSKSRPHELILLLSVFTSVQL